MYDTRVSVSEEEKKWQRREDARILARAEEIKADKERLKNAHIGAKEILEEEAQRLKGLSKVAYNPTVDKAVKKGEQIEKQQTTGFERTRRVHSNPATIGRL